DTDQGLELRIFEDLPPLEICERAGLRGSDRLVAKLLGGADFRTFIILSQHAARQQDHRSQKPDDGYWSHDGAFSAGTEGNGGRCAGSGSGAGAPRRASFITST